MSQKLRLLLKVQDKLEPAQDSWVNVVPQVQRQNGDPLESLNLFQQVVNFDIRVAIMTILNTGSFAEQRVGFVQQENYGFGFSSFECTSEILFRLANVFTDYAAQIDTIMIDA